MFQGTLFTLILLLVSACGDNSYNGTNLIKTQSLQSNAFEQIQKNVLLSDANSTLQSAHRVLAHLKAKDIEGAKSKFKELMIHLKGVDSLYVIKDFNASMRPFRDYNDIFHTHTLDAIPLALTQFLRADVNDSARLSESVKNINGLEYILFTQEPTPRNILAAEYVVEKMIERLEKITTWYANESSFYQDDQEASNSLINILIDSANKLSEWRLGDAAALTNLYKEKGVDYRRLEYLSSKLSLDAIIAILKANQRVMDAKEYEDYGDFSAQNNAINEVALIRDTIKRALTVANSIGEPIESNRVLKTEKVKALYEALNSLKFAYYQSLINALDLTPKVIEADGD